MEMTSVTSQPSLGTQAFASQAAAQPQEQQARNQRVERERDDATRANDQVTLSGAARQVAASETERVVAKTEVNTVADRPEAENRIEQARQTQIESRREEQPTPRSVARALETYTQTAALSSGNG